VKVTDVLSGKSLATVPAKGFTDKDGWSFGPNFLISDDGHTLIVANPEEKSWQVQCWNLPLHPPWTWVIGPPLGILLLAILAWQLKRRRSLHATPQQQAKLT
jgi:hypothetical protein